MVGVQGVEVPISSPVLRRSALLQERCFGSYCTEELVQELVQELLLLLELNEALCPFSIFGLSLQDKQRSAPPPKPVSLPCLRQGSLQPPPHPLFSLHLLSIGYWPTNYTP
jgi:hypothetical protein